jgi:hypothetical protein
MNIDEVQAYRAMFYFIQQQYKTLPNEHVLGQLLGGMSLLADGNTADPAYWHDWLKAIEKAKTDTDSIKLKFIK